MLQSMRGSVLCTFGKTARHVAFQAVAGLAYCTNSVPHGVGHHLPAARLKRSHCGPCTLTSGCNKYCSVYYKHALGHHLAVLFSVTAASQ